MERVALPPDERLTFIVEEQQGWFISRCLEVPGSNGQGRTRDESLESLVAAIALIQYDNQGDLQGELRLKDFLDALAATPRQVRSKTEIDQSLEEERASWD